MAGKMYELDIVTVLLCNFICIFIDQYVRDIVLALK